MSTAAWSLSHKHCHFSHTWSLPHTDCAVTDLVIGGMDEDFEVSTTEVLDLETMEFTGYGPAMLAKRLGIAAVADDAGDRVFVLGGHHRSCEAALEAAAAQEETRVSTRRRRC
jgi:hypothetical protein